MHLSPQPFKQMLCGEKTVEVRLYDEKRRALRVGDAVSFSCGEETLCAQIVSLHRADSFVELFSREGMLGKCGWKDRSPAQAAEEMRVYYSEEEEKKWGVLGIELLPNIEWKGETYGSDRYV